MKNRPEFRKQEGGEKNSETIARMKEIGASHPEKKIPIATVEKLHEQVVNLEKDIQEILDKQGGSVLGPENYEDYGIVVKKPEVKTGSYRLRRLRNYFVSGLAALNLFGGAVKGATEGGSEGKEKTEKPAKPVSTTTGKEKGSSVSYRSGVEKKSSGDVKALEKRVTKEAGSTRLEFASYFNTSKAEIPSKNREEISKVVSSYLDSLTEENLNEFLKSDLFLGASCDPRPAAYKSVTGKNGNGGLAFDRAMEAKKTIIKSVIAYYGSGEKSLKPESIQKIISKFSDGLSMDIPDNGVADYHTVINPKTGENFTDKEWMDLQKSGTQTEKNEAYENFRFVAAMLPTLTPSKQKVPIETKKNIEVIKPAKIFETKGYDKLIIFIDNSYSMKYNKGELIKDLTGSNDIIPIEIIGFTSQVNAEMRAANTQEAAKILENIPPSEGETELMIDIMIQQIKKMQITIERINVVAGSDESLQGVTRGKLTELEQLAKERNMTISFSIAADEIGEKTNRIEKRVYKLSLADLKKAYGKIYEKKPALEKAEAARRIEVYKQIMKDLEKVVADGEKDYKKYDIRATKEEIKRVADQMAEEEAKLYADNNVVVANFGEVANPIRAEVKKY